MDNRDKKCEMSCTPKMSDCNSVMDQYNSKEAFRRYRRVSVIFVM